MSSSPSLKTSDSLHSHLLKTKSSLRQVQFIMSYLSETVMLAYLIFCWTVGRINERLKASSDLSSHIEFFLNMRILKERTSKSLSDCSPLQRCFFYHIYSIGSFKICCRSVHVLLFLLSLLLPAGVPHQLLLPYRLRVRTDSGC